jgi:hypothetical protein
MGASSDAHEDLPGASSALVLLGVASWALERDAEAAGVTHRALQSPSEPPRPTLIRLDWGSGAGFLVRVPGRAGVNLARWDLDLGHDTAHDSDDKAGMSARARNSVREESCCDSSQPQTSQKRARAKAKGSQSHVEA